MAFQGQVGQESQNRRILQDIQQKRQMLLNQGQTGAGNTGTTPPASRLIASESSTSIPNKPHEVPIIRNPGDISLNQRQALEHANSTSSGYFISQDSTHGNLILPVIPRFESNDQ